MQNDQGEFRDLKDRELELLHKMAERGHGIAKVYEQSLGSEAEKLQIQYSQVGNFTIATLARTRDNYVKGLNVIGQVTGASKRHPDDDPNELIGQNIALSRALKGDYFKGPMAHTGNPEDVITD